MINLQRIIRVFALNPERKQMSINTPPQSASKALNAGLWIAQLLLGVVFIPVGFMKLSQPIADLAAMIPWVSQAPELFVRFIGLVDLAGGLGVLLPALTRIKPRLTVAAALGIVGLQLLAAAFHMSRGEASMLPLNVLLLALAAFVAWGRACMAPLAPRRPGRPVAGSEKDRSIPVA